MINWPHICDDLESKIGFSVDAQHITTVGGGCINSAYFVGQVPHQVFFKTNHISKLDMFKAEASGLTELATTKAILTPAVFSTGNHNDTAYIALQALSLSGVGHRHQYRKFGHQLAMLHRSQASQFGAEINNTIGTTPQVNTWHKDWLTFWRNNRLEFQLALALKNNAPSTMIDDGYNLSERMGALFDQPPAPACLHGDLWQGNWGFTQTGEVAIFDPAHYYGDRETDIAMTTLFGRAHPDFYAAYHDTYPLRPNYTTRETFYNLYHILNHYNLFGGGYANQAHQMILHTLSEIR